MDIKFEYILNSILVGFWLELGTQNPPKMEPSWVQNRSKLEYSFGSYLWKDLGYIFDGFATHVKIGELSKTYKNWYVFSIFVIFA